MKKRAGSWATVVLGIGFAGFVSGCNLFTAVTPPDGVDPCANVTCAGGEVCEEGDCVAAVVDPCADVTCEGDASCVDGVCVTADPQGFQDAAATRGGLMYDKWWVVAGVDAPTEDHGKWAAQDTNTRSGANTWQCKECHGWDYKGVNGAYGSGSHMTGFPGIFGTTMSAQAVFDKIETGHGSSFAGLTADDIWDLAKFVLEGQIDTATIIDADNAFIGDATAGMALFEGGIAGNPLSCMTCHGADGQLINFKDLPDEEFVGDLAAGNPWEFQHKVRFGQPGTAMPASEVDGGTNQDVADVGAYAQTLE